MANRDDFDEKDDFDEEDDREEQRERRTYRRRSSDYVTPDSFKLSLREMIVVIAAVVSIGSTFMAFNSQIDKNQAESTLKHELNSNRLTTIESDQNKLEKKVDDLKSQVDDVERTTTQLYQQMRK